MVGPSRQRLMALLSMSILVFAACSSAATTAPASGAPAASKTYKIAFALGVMPSAFGQSMYNGANAAGIALGATVELVAPPQAQPALQIAQLSAVLASKPDFLITQPDDATALVAPLQQFKNAHIPIITIDTDVSDTSLRLANITANNVKGGTIAADTMNQLLSGTGKVLYVGYVPGATTTDQRLQGWKTELAKYPGLVSVGEEYDQSSPTDAASAVGAVLTKTPDLAGIFASDESSAIGAATAVQAAGLTGKVKIVAFDAASDEVTALRAGTLTSLIVQEPYSYGYEAVQYAIAYLKNGTLPPPQTYADYVIATAANIDTPAVQKYLYAQ